MSVLTMRKPRLGPKVRLLRAPRDRRAQITRSRRRRALYAIAERDDHQLLKHIGVSREEAFGEAGKRCCRQ